MGGNSSGVRNSQNKNGQLNPIAQTSQQNLANHKPTMMGSATIGNVDELEPVSMSTVNPDLFGDIWGSWIQTKAMMGDPQCDLYVGKLNGAYGCCGYDKKTGRSYIILDKKTFNQSRKALQQDRDYGVQTGYKQSNYLMATVVHEMGHAYVNKVGYKYGDDARLDLIKTLNNHRKSWVSSSLSNRSAYANTNGNEWNSEMLTRNLNYSDRLNSVTKYSLKEWNIINDYLENGKRTKKKY